MFCPNCGNKLNGNEDFCSNCGNKINSSSDFVTFSKQLEINNPFKKIIKKIKEFILNNKKKVLICCGALVSLLVCFVLIVVIGNYIKNKDLYYKFTINDKKFRIGEEVSYYVDKGYTYIDPYYNDNNYIVSNGFMPHSFYKDGSAVMYAAIHCKLESNCKYSEGNIVKINFYNEIGEVKFANFITIGTSYDEIVEKLGEPDGKFYMNDNEFVWAFYNKGEIGNPYYVLEFDASKKVISMKIGTWWYDGEYEYTVK